MSNPLTGDYEAVVQIATRQINGLLATIHNNSDREARIKLLRYVVTRFGDVRRRPPDLGDFQDWVVEFQASDTGRRRDAREHVTATAPPGIAKMFARTFDRFDGEWGIELPPTPPDVVRGIAKVQVSTVTVTVPDNSTSEVTVNAHIRAVFYPDPDTNSLPAPIHGGVSATYNVTPRMSRRGLRLMINPSADDSKIQFVAAAGSGLSPFDQNRISAQVRKFVRESIVQQPIDIPDGFPFTEFKGLGSGTSQVIALPLQLSDATATTNRLSTLTQSFVGSNGFALAVSKAHILTVIDLDAIRQEIERQKVTARIGVGPASYSATYSFRVTRLEATFHDESIKISGSVDAVASGAPNAWVTFDQSIGFVFDANMQRVGVFRKGDPDVDESWWLPHAPVVSKVREQFDKVLPTFGPVITSMLARNRNKLVNGLNAWIPGVGAAFSVLHVTTSGITLGGNITGPARRAPVVEIEQTHQGTAFTALKSWVPGGRIDRFTWSWVEFPRHGGVWSGVRRSVIDEHNFIVPKPTGISDVSQICLRVDGTQVLPSGELAGVVGGSTCLVAEPEIALDVPSWWGPLTVPLWRPVRGDRGPLRESISGHLDIAASAPRDGRTQHSALVFFADDHPIDALFEALRLSKNGEHVTTTVVVPMGTFDKSRSEVENLLGLTDNPPRLTVTEDDEGAWTKAFDVSKSPAAYLLDAHRELVWQSSGELNSRVLAAAVDKVAAPTKQSAFRPLEMKLQPGDAPRNFAFADRDDRFALHHLRGTEVVLNFWQSWSAPCLAELERLQSLHEGRTGPFVAAFHGGVSAEPIDQIRKRLGLSFPLIQDARQTLARRFGVRCWPTTITIGADGRVEHIQLGTAHDHGRPDPKRQ